MIQGKTKNITIQSKKGSGAEPQNKELARLIESGVYYDMLDNFDTAVMQINEKAAADGEEPKTIQRKFLKLLPAFIALCGGNIKKDGLEFETEPDKRGQYRKAQAKAKTVIQSNLHTMNGWGICPTCGKKCIKLQEKTVIVDFPMFCKCCKREYIVTWVKPS